MSAKTVTVGEVRATVNALEVSPSKNAASSKIFGNRKGFGRSTGGFGYSMKKKTSRKR